MTRKKIVAADILKAQASDRKFQDESAKREVERQKHAIKMREEQESLLDDLKHAGVSTGSLWELVSGPNNYTGGVGVLVNHLNKDYSIGTLDGIVRALSFKGARGKANIGLRNLFDKTDNDRLRASVANAMSVVANEGDAEWLKRTLLDKQIGGCRDMLTHAWARIFREEAYEFLLSLLSDETLLAETIYAIGILKVPDSDKHIHKFLNHPDSWVRQKSRDAIKKIKKKKQKNGVRS